MRGRIEAFGRIENEINERLSGFPELNQMFASKQSDAMKRAVVDPTNPQVERLYDSNAQVDDEMMNIPIFFRSQIGIEDSNRVAESIARSDAGSRVKILQELVNNGEAKIDGVVLRPSLAHFPIKPADVEWLSRNISKFDELLDSLALDEGELYGVTFLRSREQLERMYEKSQKHGFPPELASLLIRHGFLDFSRNAQEFEQAAKRIGATRQEVTRVVRDMRKYLAVDEKIVATHLRDTSTPSIEELILRNISSARGILRSSGLLEADVVKCFVR
jgi:hypothetical protein